MYLSIYPSIYLHLSIYLSIYLSTSIYLRLSIYLHRDYMNSLGRNRNSIQDQYGSDTDPPVDGNLVTENNTDQ